MEEELDYEFEQENVPPAVEGVVIISDSEENDDNSVLVLDTSRSLEQQPVST